MALADDLACLCAGTLAGTALPVGPDGGREGVEDDVHGDGAGAALPCGREAPSTKRFEHLVADRPDREVAVDHLTLLADPSEVGQPPAGEPDRQSGVDRGLVGPDADPGEEAAVGAGVVGVEVVRL